MAINLTNPQRKNTPAPKPKQFWTSKDANDNWISEAKYSKVFQDAGLDFVKAYEVIRLKYWLEYEIIGHAECGLYDTLHLFAKKGIEFTTDFLSTAIGISSATLRQLLDNLENAELIEIIKVRDEFGERNEYIIKSPLYDKSTFTETKKFKIIKADQEMPEIFLEDRHATLKSKVKVNKVKLVRALLRKKDLSADEQRIKNHWQQDREDRTMLWRMLVKTFGDSAIKFDTLVWRIIQYKNLQNEDGVVYEQPFLEILERECGRVKLGWNSFYKTIAIKLKEFYEDRLRFSGEQPARQPQTTADVPSSDHADQSPGERRAAEFDLLKKIIAEKTADVKVFSSYLIENLTTVFKTYGANLSEIELDAAAAVLPGDVWRKLKVEIIN